MNPSQYFSGKAVQTFRDLHVYQHAFESAVSIYELSRGFPAEERYSLTDQIRRSSRSICANIAEAWRKRRYSAHFVSKLSDADAEASETLVWLDFALRFKYIKPDAHKTLTATYDHVGAQLGLMMASPEKWRPKPTEPLSDK